MAETLVVNNTTVKVRNPLGVLGLSIVTFGIYGIYHFFAVLGEIKNYSNDRAGVGPGSFWWILVPIAGIFILYSKVFNGVKFVQQETGVTPLNTGLAWILTLFTGLGMLYVQSELNKTWQVANSTSGGSVPAPAKEMAGV
jgi:hypothetical protein